MALDSGIRVARIFGIPVHLHPTWFLVFLLVVLGLWNHLEADYPAVGPVWRMVTALTTAALLFGSVLMHELGHSLLALRHRVAVRSITLFIFGGVAWMEREPDSPRAELEIAVAGPAASALLGVAFGVFSGLFAEQTLGLAIFQWLTTINISIAVFNLLPGFPMDGGRVLRALLWLRDGDPARATRVAARVGQGIAYGMVGLGALLALQGLFGGIWLAFIGWFVLSASGATRRQAALELSLRGLRARDLMKPELETLDASTPVGVFAREFVMRGERWAIVMRNGQPQGLVTLTDVRRLAPEAWDSTPVEQVATPLDQVVMVSQDVPAREVLRLLSEHQTNQIPILDGETIIGAVTRQNVLQAIEIRGGDG